MSVFKGYCCLWLDRIPLMLQDWKWIGNVLMSFAHIFPAINSNTDLKWKTKTQVSLILKCTHRVAALVLTAAYNIFVFQEEKCFNLNYCTGWFGPLFCWKVNLCFTLKSSAFQHWLSSRIVCIQIHPSSNLSGYCSCLRSRKSLPQCNSTMFHCAVYPTSLNCNDFL